MANKKSIPDFARIKEEVGFEQILKHYGILDGLKRKHDQLTGPCPIHKGDGKSCFNVHLGKNCFNCFSCRAHGNILVFVGAMEGVELKEAGYRLSNWFNVPLETGYLERKGGQGKTKPKEALIGEGKSLPRRMTGEEPAEPINPPLTFELKNLDPKHPYLKERGLTSETICHFGLGFCKRGLMAGRVVIPIHNENKELIAYAGRAIDKQCEKEGRYKLPPRFQKSYVLFNLHRAKEYAKDNLILVEGYFSVFRLWQAGFSRAVALMGSSLSKEQEELITSTLGRGGRITLLFDNDNAGKACEEDCLRRLSKQCFVKACSLPAGVRQVDELAEQAIKDLFL